MRVGELQRYALIDRQGDGLRVHGLVQAAVRDSLAAEFRPPDEGVALIWAASPAHAARWYS